MQITSGIWGRRYGQLNFSDLDSGIETLELRLLTLPAGLLDPRCPLGLAGVKEMFVTVSHS